jgi:cytochrome oxidase assembly protein ShyY1
MTFNAYKWQKRRRYEKIAEMDIRYKRLNGKPYTFEGEKFPWADIDESQLKADWEFMPVKVKGHFDNTKTVYIQRTKDNEPGYQMVNPFYCGDVAILVDRGWVPGDWLEIRDNFESYLNKPTEIIGILYKGDKLNKYSEDKITTDNNILLTMDPGNIAEICKLNNVSGQFMLKELSTGVKEVEYPRKLKINELMTWYITPETHQSYSNFWLFITVMNILSNCYIWLL